MEILQSLIKKQTPQNTTEQKKPSPSQQIVRSASMPSWAMQCTCTMQVTLVPNPTAPPQPASSSWSRLHTTLLFSATSQPYNARVSVSGSLFNKISKDTHHKKELKFFHITEGLIQKLLTLKEAFAPSVSPCCSHWRMLTFSLNSCYFLWASAVLAGPPSSGTCLSRTSQELPSGLAHH